MTVELSNIQANLFYGSECRTHCRYVFYRVNNPDGVADALSGLRGDLVHNADQAKELLTWNVNLAFTYHGLDAIGVEYNDDDRYERDFLGRPPDPGADGDAADAGTPKVPPVSAFEAGMRAASLGRTPRLNDRWPKEDGKGVWRWPKDEDEDEDGEVAHPWWSGKPTELWEKDPARGPHVLVLISVGRDHGNSAEARRDWLHAYVSFLASGGFEEIGYQDAALLSGLKEHFGFKDGESQPAIKGLRPGKPGDGKISPAGWAPLETGEFLLGHCDEGYQKLPLPKPEKVTKDGTYLVYRKLSQDVAGFRKFVDKIAASGGLSPDEIGDKVVGRKADGTALVPTPADSRNDFRFSEDPDGYGCPIGSHVRRSNPRDALGFDGRLANGHRIVRRGMPYGAALPEGEGDDAVDRGLIFICLNARIEDQFEFIQSQWLDGGRAFRLGDEPDVIAGSGTKARVVINAEPPIVRGTKTFTRFRGGEYFFVPSCKGLDEIIATAAPVDPAPVDPAS